MSEPSDNLEEQLENQSDPPPPPVETPEEPTDPLPDPGPAPTPDIIEWEPRTWYAITYACLNPDCVNLNIVGEIPMFYSNDGQPKNIRVFDTVCQTDSKILTATKLDPQPIEE